jgi:tRNA(fMet)-specific endonuclease VapC
MIDFMLDTNIVIYVMKRKPLPVLETFKLHENRLFISSITLAELHYGVAKSQQVERNQANLGLFLGNVDVRDYDLKRNGQIIGDNDMHIAAHARSLGMCLVTNNTDEFSRVQGLFMENWVALNACKNDTRTVY